MKHGLIISLLSITLASFSPAADAPNTIGDFGPTGLEVYAQKDLSLKIASVMPGSPSDGKLEKDQLITAINGQQVDSSKGRSKNWFPRATYSDKNNKLRESLKPGANVLTAKSFLQYFKGKEGDLEVYLEGLREMPKPN